MKKILEYVLMGSLLASCATTNLKKIHNQYTTLNLHNQEYKIEDLSKVYVLAAIKAGTMKVYKKEKSWNGKKVNTTFMAGTTKPHKQRKYLEQIIRLADTNNDKKITKKEIKELEKYILEKYSIKK
jgi:hypothetical protein